MVSDRSTASAAVERGTLLVDNLANGCDQHLTRICVARGRSRSGLVTEGLACGIYRQVMHTEVERRRIKARIGQRQNARDACERRSGFLYDFTSLAPFRLRGMAAHNKVRKCGDIIRRIDVFATFSLSRNGNEMECSDKSRNNRKLLIQCSSQPFNGMASG